MAKRALWTVKGRAMGLRELLDRAIERKNREYKTRSKESVVILTEKSKLSPAVQSILEEQPIVYKRR